MKVLVINAGSSTLKFQLIDMEDKNVLAKGMVEKINESGSFLKYKAKGEEFKFCKDIVNHRLALEFAFEKLTDNTIGVIGDLSEISAFGHRVVNVGESYFDSVLIDDKALEDFRLNADFSPLHVPGAIAGIEGAFGLFPNKPNVAVFDVGFHKSIPEHVYRYALPKKYYDLYKIRRYGAHGTSHYYITKRTAEILGKNIEDVNIISCHLGSGASITAVKNGKSFDTSMGFTPLEGIIMNTRSGDIDPAVVEFICNKEGKTASEVIKILNKESGLLGSIGNGIVDMRDITANINLPEVKLAYDMYCYRIKKYICGYVGILGGVDAIVFTAGVGENTPRLREDVLANLEFMGIAVDKEANNNLPRGQEGDISLRNSKVRVLVVPTDEEIVIAEETLKIVNKLK